MSEKKLPLKSAQVVFKEVKEEYLHWKHRTFGRKPELTEDDVKYLQRVKHLVEEHALLVTHWASIDTFFRESNKFMTQNEVLAQCARDVVKEDDTNEHFYGSAF